MHPRSRDAPVRWTARIARILEADPKARVCVVSALDQKHVLKQAFQIGAADFIVKPFDRQALIETLEKLVAPQFETA